MGRLVITNFPHGTREALHLGYKEVPGWNPRVIYADLLEAEFRSQPLAHWKEVLDTARVPYGVMQSPEEAAADPQLRAADIVVPIEGARDLDYTVNKPITLRGLARVPFRRAHEHLEHTDEVLAQLGFSAAEIAQLEGQKAIPAAPEQETTK
jgi:crotonobetainyl-CoA:carnitine CoA-transferase CaiB-like acyl-CoA transferase